MTCQGCAAGAKFTRDPGYTGTNPVIDPISFEPDETTNPDGTCTGTPCHQTAPCTPVGYIMLANCYPTPVVVHYRLMPGGSNWADKTVKSGTWWAIRMAGDASIDCGASLLMAEVFDAADPTTRLGTIDFTCSSCGEEPG